MYQIYNVIYGSLMTAVGHDDTSVSWVTPVWIAVLMMSEASIVAMHVHMYRKLVTLMGH